MLAAILHRIPALGSLRVQFAALAAVTALPFVAGAAYDIWFAMQTASGIFADANSHVIEVRIGGLAIALIVSGLLAVLIVHRMIPSRPVAAEAAPAMDAAALNAMLERRVEMRTRNLERSIRELESHATVVSQNLREPLGAVEACAALIERHHRAQLDGQGSMLLDRLRGNVRRMSALVDALIEYARLGRRRLVRQALDMTELVKATLEDMPLGEQDRERVTVESLPPVSADATLLAQVWRHLIDNALKFSAGSPGRAVRIEGEVRHGVAEYRVTDAGSGFDPAATDRLFRLFERLHGEDLPGAGAGLAIVKRIVERHGGLVWAEGAPGKGATFGFALPLRPQS